MTVVVETSDRQLAALCAESTIACRADIGGLGLAGLAGLPGDEQPVARIAIAPTTSAHSGERGTSERTGTSASGRLQHNSPDSAASGHSSAKRRESSAAAASRPATPPLRPPPAIRSCGKRFDGFAEL